MHMRRRRMRNTLSTGRMEADRAVTIFLSDLTRPKSLGGRGRMRAAHRRDLWSAWAITPFLSDFDPPKEPGECGTERRGGVGGREGEKARSREGERERVREGERERREEKERGDRGCLWSAWATTPSRANDTHSI